MMFRLLARVKCYMNLFAFFTVKLTFQFKIKLFISSVSFFCTPWHFSKKTACLHCFLEQIERQRKRRNII